MGVDYSHAHAAILLIQLPSESRIAKKQSVELEWTYDQYLLNAIEYDLRILIWQQTKDAQTGRNKPEKPKLPSERKKERRGEFFDKELIDKVLGGVN